MLHYNFAVRLYVAMIRIAAMGGNPKAQQWLEGRRNWRERIKKKLGVESVKEEERIWFHCSSLGEFEQGRPVIEKLKMKFKASGRRFKIVLTFFSPSGYEIRKNYSFADYVFYLPVDTQKNAFDFIELIQPKEVFFVKYDYWFHYLKELNKRNVPIYFVSSLFRSDHRYFKWYGKFFKRMLGYVTHFFVQNEESKKLLHSIGHNNSTVCGDTRFDRVIQITQEAKKIEAVEQFKDNKPLLVAGSTWPKDEEILIQLLADPSLFELRIVIVPHEILHHHIGNLEYLLVEHAKLKPDEIVLYSQTINHENVSSPLSHSPILPFSPSLLKARVLIIDTVGLLSSIYRYADMAYLGGGFGKGIHNILEAAVYGMPVFFGPNYKKFSEAFELINAQAAFPIQSSDELSDYLHRFMNNKDEKEQAALNAKNYVLQHSGATEKILHYLETKDIQDKLKEAVTQSTD